MKVESDRHAKWRKNNPEKIKAYKKIYKIRYPEKYKASYENYNAKNSEDRARKRLERIYGITMENYLALYDEQGGVCAICKKSITKKRLCVDHDHKTGKIRGLLCSYCNTGIGLFRDDLALLNSAIKYLGR